VLDITEKASDFNDLGTKFTVLPAVLVTAFALLSTCINLKYVPFVMIRQRITCYMYLYGHNIQ